MKQPKGKTKQAESKPPTIPPSGGNTTIPVTPLPQRSWVIYMTLVIAVFGAIFGGGYNLYNVITDKPDFYFAMEGVITSDSYNDFMPTEKHTSFLLSGSIGNDGKKPLFIKGYTAKLIDKENDISYVLSPAHTDSTYKKLQTKGNTYYIDSVITRDLSFIKRVSSSDAQFGNMLFISQTAITIQPSKKYTFEITCIDTKDKVYLSEFPFEVTTEGTLPRDFPGTGVRIVPKG